MSNQPTPPYDVPPQSKSNAYNPITLEDVQPPEPDSFFQGLENLSSRIVAVVLFGGIFFTANRSAVATPVALLILLACLLYRMTPRERAITAAPLTFSAVRLAQQFTEPLGIWRYTTPLSPQGPAPFLESGSTWLPLFLAVYLFFTPTRYSKSYRVAFWYSISLLLSGLLPGAGYLVVCSMLFYTLFFAIVISLAMDLSENSHAPRPMAQPPQLARP